MGEIAVANPQSRRNNLRAPKLQAATETVALQRFALVALARHVNAARDRLDAARPVEAAARERVDQTSDQIQSIKDEILHLAAAAYRNHTWAGRSASTRAWTSRPTLAG